jgi:hypothetical protein
VFSVVLDTRVAELGMRYIGRWAAQERERGVCGMQGEWIRSGRGMKVCQGEKADRIGKG